MTVQLHWLHQIQPADRNLVGDKAFYLGDLRDRGYPVIPGWVVPAIAFRAFLESINWLEPLFEDLPNSSLHIDVDNSTQLQAIAHQIRQAILTTPLSPALNTALQEVIEALPQSTTLILRPSLSLQTDVDPLLCLRTAGLLDSKLCPATVESLATHLRQVWAELFRARSLFYWQRSRVQLQHVNLGVLIQPLYDAIAAGSLQVDPFMLQLQAVHGLGIALVHGEAQPEKIWISGESAEIRQRNRSQQTQIYRLAYPTQPGSDPPSKTSSGLQIRLTSEADLLHPVLPDAVLQNLVHLGQTLCKDLGMSLQLEWLYGSPQPEAEPQLYVTQASPQLSSVLKGLASPLPTEPADLMSMRSASESSIPQGGNLTQNQAAGPVLVTGLAASSGQVTAPAVVMTNSDRKTLEIPPGSILVAPTITPDWLPFLHSAAGIVAEQGGMTCHGAIIARELGIPAVVGAAQATGLIQSGSIVRLDGDRGTVSSIADSATPSAQPFAERAQPTLEAWTASTITQRLPIATSLWVNVSQPRSLTPIRDLPIDGLGLLRSELMLLNLLDGQHPQVWLQHHSLEHFVQTVTQQLIQFAQAFAPRPVFYRSFDGRSHEFRIAPPVTITPPEVNPMLGLRGTLSYQADPALFDLELKALAQVQQAGYTNVNLLLPFVRTVEEFSFCRDRVQQIGLSHHPQFQLWIMAEVPSVLFLLPEYVEAGVQGISIGTNDLTQLLLGVDRDHGPIASAFDERHPAVLAAIAQLIQTAQQQGIPCSICGQAPARYPDLIESFVRWGVTSISVEPQAVEQTYGAIVRAEKKLLLEMARRGSSGVMG